RRVRAKGTAPAESAPSPIQPPSTLPSPLASPHSTRAARRVLRQRDACAYPFNVLPATPRRRARYFATLLAHSYLSIWLSQIVQPADWTRTSVRRDPRPRLGDFRLRLVRETIGDENHVVSSGRNRLLFQLHKVPPRTSTQMVGTPCRIRTCDL